MRAISFTTADKYRKNAKWHNDIAIEILKIRLNCIIDATSKEHVHRRGNTTIYQFGSCLLFVKGNIISDIRWTGRDEMALPVEQKRLTALFVRNGLHYRGYKYADETIRMS